MRSISTAILAGVLAGFASSSPAEELEKKPEHGTVHFEPAAGNVPPVHRLDAHTFDYELKPKADLRLAGVSVLSLTFPSALDSPFEVNNTVYADYYRPHGKGPFPAVIVLDILDGSEVIPRTQATLLAQNGIAALHVRMAYYGPRRPAQGNVRLMSMDIPRTLSGVRQTVLDCRRATAWLAARPEIEPARLGVMGTSLGSFIAALTAEAEPRLNKIALLYGGGGFVDGYCDHPRAKPYLKNLESLGISKNMLKWAIASVDPLTHAENLKGRDVLMIAAKRDDIVPPKMAEALWEACAKPKIIWFDTNHYGAALYALPAMQQVLVHFRWKQ
jgi:dienelactone hydrolase